MRIFLSYHTPDRAIALALKGAMEAALPGADVFLDQTHLRAGHLWQPALFDAIAKAQAFLILVSTRVGEWQKFEYYEALDRKAKDDAFILLPVIIADPAAGPAANLPGLAQLHWIESTEPAAPDPLAKILSALQSRAPEKSPEPWRAINPYRGLVALEEQDADFFFGRERETGDILAKIVAASGRFIALVGNSGVGKSSLVQAGVIGSLKRQRWPGRQQPWPQALKDSRAFAYLAMKPGEDPIDALMAEVAALWFPDPTEPKRVDRRREWAERLRHGKARFADVVKATDDHLRTELALTPPPRICLYIDQGEELYVRTPRAERKRFSEIIADGLADIPQRLIVMTSQRADYYGELQANAALFDVTERIDVPPLKADDLAVVLREPARVLGAGFESDDLIGHVVRAAQGQAGALPLLADLFTDLWERMRERGDGTLRVSDRREIIQVGAALCRRADQFLAQHQDKADAVKRLFTLRLAHVPRQGEPVRARWERDARGGTGSPDAEWALAEQLAGPEWRLLVTGETDGKATAEVAHEILLKTWPTLEHWLENEREFLVWRGEIAAQREDYEKATVAGGREQRQALLMGLPLDAARTWLAARRVDIEPTDRAFIEASVRAVRAAARNRQRLQALIYLLLIGVIAGLVGWMNQDSVKEQWRLAMTIRPYIRDHARPYVLSAERERALKPGERFQECDKDCPEMVVLPAGQFIMGSPPSEDSGNGTGPPHEVTIAKAFAVGRFDVTFDEWDACVRYGACDSKISDSGWGRGRQPVINVTWEDARTYVDWLSKVTGRSYRLLSEAEWEYAARAGSNTVYSFGDDPAALGEYAWYSANSGNRAHPVGEKKPNGFGLYDMHGNVWQWVADCVHNSYKGAPRDGSVWTNGDCTRRVNRGGSWFLPPQFLRSARRFAGTPVIRNYDLGFRVGRTLSARAGATTVAPDAH